METVEDSGWKLIHGDVFRPPRDSDLFATVVGTGVQVFWTLITVIVLAAAGILSPAYHRQPVGFSHSGEQAAGKKTGPEQER